MAANSSRFAAYRPFILWPSLLGLGMVAVLVSLNVVRGDHDRALVIAPLFGWPFVLGLLALVSSMGVGARRWMLAIAAIGAAVLAFPLIFNGTGFWFLAIGIVYAWVWWNSRHLPA